ncbi:MAG: hypothetical protein AMXMBFR82_24430 [Candidatus Hydrogenedentota bacterium]
MNPIVALNPEFSARFVMTLAHFLWQGAAIGIFAIALGAVLRRASARLRYGIFLIALSGMALCPPVTFLMIESGAMPTPNPELAMGPIDLGMGAADHEGYRTYRTDGKDRTDRSDPSDQSDRSDAAMAASIEADTNFEATAPQANPEPANLEFATAPPTAANWRDYTPYLILAYLAGVVVMLARLGLGLAGGGSLRKRAERISDNAILEAVRRHAQLLKLRAVPVVAYCHRVAVPTVVGVIRPMILLPASLATGMPPLQVELLLLHELAHIRRYDHAVNILQRVIEAALFFHPAVWYVSHRIRVEREHCCDDLVIALGGERHAYAESLIGAAALASGMRLSPAALAATGKPSQLRKRIHRLLEEPAPPVRLVRGGWVLTALAIVALVAGATQFSGPTSETPVIENLIKARATEDLAIVPEPVETLQVAEAPKSESEDASEPDVAQSDPPSSAPLSEQESNAKAMDLYVQTQDPDWWLRKVAVQQLGELPHSTGIVQSLIGMLKDEDARVQAAAAEALAKQGDPQAVKHLVAALKEESEVRDAAAEALTHFKHEDVMPLLTLAARDEDMTVRLGAILGLGKQNTAEAAEILVGLLPEFYDEDPSRRGPMPPRPPVRSRSNRLPVNPAELRPTGAAVAEALSAMDPAIARPALLEAATSSDWRTLMQTALVIGASDMRDESDLQNALLGMLKHERKDVRAAAAQVLSEAVKARVAAGESASPEVLAALEPLLRDPNRAITWIAADALRGSGWQPSSTEERAWFLVAIGQGQEASSLGSVALEPFLHALNADSSPAFDQQGKETNPPRDIVQWLSELDDPGKVEPLISVLTRFGDNTTMEVASVLGTTGDPRAFEPLAGLLGHLNADVQGSALWALGKLNDPRAVEPLIAMLDHPNENVREQAIKALGEIGDPRAADAVRPLLENEDGLVVEAAKALGAFKDAKSAPRIAELYRETNPDSGNNDTYVNALVSIDGNLAEQTFMEILKGNPSENKRWQSAKALGELRSTEAIPLLREAILFDTNDKAKRAAIGALGNIGGDEAARALTTLQEMQDWRTRNLYLEYADDIATAFSAMDDQISSDPLARLYRDCEKEQYRLPARLTAATTLAKRGDPRGKTMLQELQNIPETRIAATNALQEMAQQSGPEADTATPAGAADRTDQTDRTDQSDQSTSETQPTTQLLGPRLQFRWVVEGEDAVGKTVLPAPTEEEPDRTLVVGDDVVFYERDVQSAITKKDPNGDAYAVFFVTTEDGEKRLWNATEQNQGKRLAIIFDGRVLSAPVVQSAIGKSGQITGDLTEEEAEVIAGAINDALGDDEGESMPKPILYDKLQPREAEPLNVRERIAPEVVEPR